MPKLRPDAKIFLSDFSGHRSTLEAQSGSRGIPCKTAHTTFSVAGHPLNTRRPKPQCARIQFVPLWYAVEVELVSLTGRGLVTVHLY